MRLYNFSNSVVLGYFTLNSFNCQFIDRPRFQVLSFDWSSNEMFLHQEDNPNSAANSNIVSFPSNSDSAMQNASGIMSNNNLNLNQLMNNPDNPYLHSAAVLGMLSLSHPPYAGQLQNDNNSNVAMPDFDPISDTTVDSSTLDTPSGSPSAEQLIIAETVEKVHAHHSLLANGSNSKFAGNAAKIERRHSLGDPVGISATPADTNGALKRQRSPPNLNSKHGRQIEQQQQQHFQDPFAGPGFQPFHAAQQRMVPTSILASLLSSKTGLPDLAASCNVSQMQQMEQMCSNAWLQQFGKSYVQQNGARQSPLAHAQSLPLTTAAGGAFESRPGGDVSTLAATFRPPSQVSRSEKRLVPPEERGEAYLERRRKNNEAAKKSRNERKRREHELAVKSAMIEQENVVLRAQCCALQEEVQQLRNLLLMQSNQQQLTAYQVNQRATAGGQQNME